ncbi:MAG: hypothetical protein ACLGI3_10980 [Actinomycetes bacterium]
MHASGRRGTGRRRLAALPLAGVLLLTGCPAPPPSAEPLPPPPSPSTSAARPTPARPVYEGPPPGAPPSAGPLTTLRASVDLTPAMPGHFSRAEAAVAAPDGGAYVVVSPERRPGRSPEPSPPQQLVTVAGAGGGFALTRSVPIPAVADVSAVHLLPDGAVAVSGRLQDAGVPGGGYGFHVVDPATGAGRTTTVPYGEGAVSSFGHSALSPDGRTMYLFLSVATRTGVRERLIAVDAVTGAVVAARDLRGAVAAVSEAPAGHEVAGLVPRPGGGVTLAFDAAPDPIRRERVPTLLTFGADLQPGGEPVGVTTLSEGGETQAIAAGADGTVFLVVEVTEGAWILAVPDAGIAGPVLVQLADHLYDYALAVEPAQVWGLLPAYEGVRAVDLTTEEIRGPVGVGCPGQDVRGLVAAPEGALVIGQCNSPRTRTQMLWFIGPDGGP